MTADRIDSPKNPRVRSWIDLRNRRARDTTGTFIVEGERETTRMAGVCEIVSLIVREDRIADHPDATVVVSDRVFAALSTREHPDGVAAILRTPDMGVDRLNSTSLVLVGDGIEKPGNIGAMIRTADAFGAGFLGSSLSTDLVNHNVIRSAQGSLFASPQAAVARPEAIEWASANTSVVIATPEADDILWDVDLTVPTTLVVGAEAHGVDDAWLTVGSGVRIPTTGRADSLNASVAAAVVLAEAVRQRSG